MSGIKWIIRVDAPGMPYSNGQEYYLDDKGNYVSANEAYRFNTKKDAVAAGAIWGMGKYNVRRVFRIKAAE